MFNILKKEHLCGLLLFFCLVAKSCLLFATSWTVACQAPLSMGFSMASLVEWVAISFSRGSSRPKDQSCVSYTGRWILYHWATREAVFCCFSAKFSLNLFSGKMLGYFQQVPWKLHICACLCQCHPFCPWNLLPLSFSVLFWLTRLYFKALLWHSLVRLFFFYQEFTEPSAMLGAGALTRNVTFIHSFPNRYFLKVYNVPAAVLGTGNPVVSKLRSLPLWSLDYTGR